MTLSQDSMMEERDVKNAIAASLLGLVIALAAFPAGATVYGEPHALQVGDSYLLPIDGYTGDLWTTEPKTDANDGQNGDCPYFQRYRVQLAHNSGNCTYWCSSKAESPNEKWVDYKPPLDICGTGRYHIIGKYRNSENRAPYPALYIVYHTAGTTTVEKHQTDGTSGDCIYFTIGDFDLGSTGYLRVKDTGGSSITWDPMEFKYLGPTGGPDTEPPTVPTNVQATALSSTQIRITWTASTDNVGVTGYRIYRNGTQVGTSVVAGYTDTGLTPSTTYSYTVSAYDAAGNNSAQSTPPVQATTQADTGAPSIILQPQPQEICPGKSAIFTVAANGTGTLTYQWQKNGSDLANGGHYSGVTTTTLTVSSADSGDAANYRCVVTNTYGSATSNNAALTLIDCSAPLSVSAGGHFLVWRGKKALLVGDSVTQGWFECGTNFNTNGYVDALTSRGINVLMIWSYIGITDQVGDARIGYDAPEIWPWVKNGSTFDLTQLNDAYFNRLRSLVQYANSKDIVVLITIHDGWTKTRFPGHPFNSAVGGPLTDKSQYVELSDYNNEMPVTYNPSWNRQQKNQYFMERYCDRIIQATSDLAGVIYEMFNEGEWYNQTNLGNFEAHFLNFFKARSTRITMNNGKTIGSVNFRNVANCNSISYHFPNWSSSTNATDSFNTFAPEWTGTPVKPFFFSEPVPEYQGDSSLHKALTRLMWGTVLAGSGFVVQNDCSFGWDPHTAIAAQAANRDAVYDLEGHCCRFLNASGISVGSISPQASLASTGVCMADTGKEYVVWTQTQSFTVNLSAAGGTCICRYYNPRTGAFGSTFYVAGGQASTAFTAPDANDWVLHIVVGGSDTTTPTVPTDVQAAAVCSNAVQVTWSASIDNVAVAGYKVYREGVLVGTSASTSYMDAGLIPNTTYYYTVSAYDGIGNESAQSWPYAQATTPVESGSGYVSADLGAINANYLLSTVSNSDGDLTTVTAGGIEARKPVDTGDRYFYFAADDSFAYDTDATMYLEVLYYDDQATSVYLRPEYDSTYPTDPYGQAGAYYRASAVYFTNSGAWKVATWQLDHCRFANRENNGADFRIYVGTTAGVKIDAVRISKIPIAAYTTAWRDLGAGEQYHGLTLPATSDGDTVIATYQARSCRRCQAAGDNYFYFNVSDAVIYNGSNPTLYLKVEYFDSASGQITPEYDSNSNAYTAAATVNLAGSNTWKEANWTLTNCKFANSQNAGADFRLSVGTAQNVYIDKVTISKKPFTDTEPPAVPTNVQAAAKTPTAISLTWSPSADNFGTTGYRVFRGGVQVGTSATLSYLDTGLQPSSTYSYAVSAYDWVANESAQSSPPVEATTMAAGEIAFAKRLPDAAQTGLAGKVVTAAYGTFCYVEEPSRFAGMLVVPAEMPAWLAVGNTVDVGGVMQTSSDGERCIGGATITLSSTGSVGPLAVSNRFVGGASWFFTEGSSAGQEGVKDGLGTNNIGLLVRTWGRVTHVETEFFYLDDGSRLEDGSGNVGVRVNGAELDLPAENQYAAVTGVSSCYRPGSELLRMIRLRSQDDISVLQ